VGEEAGGQRRTKFAENVDTFQYIPSLAGSFPLLLPYRVFAACVPPIDGKLVGSAIH
jgi:hypothetical protein